MLITSWLSTRTMRHKQTAGSERAHGPAGRTQKLAQRAQALPFGRGDDKCQAAIRCRATGAEMV